jgi:hypothetical protein
LNAEAKLSLLTHFFYGATMVALMCLPTKDKLCFSHRLPEGISGVCDPWCCDGEVLLREGEGEPRQVLCNQRASPSLRGLFYACVGFKRCIIFTEITTNIGFRRAILHLSAGRFLSSRVHHWWTISLSTGGIRMPRLHPVPR